MSDFDPNDLFIEPRPDEDAWEAYAELALERIGGERSEGLGLQELGALEELLECQLPFEVGLFLIMGVPSAEPWRQWEDPATEWPAWNQHVLDGIRFDVEHNDFWFHEWQPKPATLAAQLAIATEQFETVPKLFPLWRNCAVPLDAADGQANSDGNPVFSIDRTGVALRGDDLAAWMHHEFEVPLPMWPAEQREFPFWSELAG